MIWCIDLAGADHDIAQAKLGRGPAQAKIDVQICPVRTAAQIGMESEIDDSPDAVQQVGPVQFIVSYEAAVRNTAMIPECPCEQAVAPDDQGSVSHLSSRLVSVRASAKTQIAAS
jgi:hypothetical protein